MSLPNIINVKLENRSHFITESHKQEWARDSGVHPDIVRENVRSLSGDTPYEYLLYSDNPSLRRNDGRLRDGYLKRYDFTIHGGWWCSGLDILSGTESLWGCFKADRPRLDPGKPGTGKRIKYEHPPKVDLGYFALKVTRSIWGKVAKRFKVELPDLEAIADQDISKAFWEWVIDNPTIPVLITEGAKKTGALLSLGYVVLGLPGVNAGYRAHKDAEGNIIETLPRYLIPVLELLAKDRAVTICYDQDKTPKTVKRVNGAIATTGKLLEKAGAKVSVITWQQPEKGVDDLIVTHGAKAFHNAYKRRSPLEIWELNQQTDITSLVDLRVHQRYLDIPLKQIPQDAQIIAVKSAKGTGKTEWLAKVASQTNAENKRVLVITHRIQLAQELARRFGLDHISEIRTSDTGGILGYALCADSLHPDSQARFNFTDWDEATVIIDEVEQVFQHMLSSSTCSYERAKILDTFKDLILYVIGTKGKVFLSDADLTPISLEMVRGLLSPYQVKTFVIENSYQLCLEQQRDLTVYPGDSDPRHLVAAMDGAIARGKKLICFTAAQKAKSTNSTKNLEIYYRRKYPELKILRIDAESIAEPGHPAYGCMDSLNEILPLYDLVLCSPAVETGVSIDIKGHFDSVWGIASGVQTVNGFCQGLERVRDNIPRHIWLPKFSRNKIGNGGYTPRAIARDQHQYAALAHKLSGAAAADIDGLDNDSFKPFLWAYCRYAAVINRGMGDYKTAILEKLKAEGYTITEATPGDDQAAKDRRNELVQVKEENYGQERKAIAAQDDPDDHQLEILKRKRAKTQQERYQERHGILARKFGLTVTADLVKRDDDGWYSQLRIEYYLTKGREFLAPRDRKTFEQLSHEGKVFKPDYNGRSLSPKVRALEVLNISQFMTPGVTFTGKSLESWFEDQILPVAKDIKRVLGITITEQMTPLEAAQALLRKVGRKLKYIGRFGSKDNRQRVYESVAPDDDRDKVFEYWLQRDRAAHPPVSTPCIYKSM